MPRQPQPPLQTAVQTAMATPPPPPAPPPTPLPDFVLCPERVKVKAGSVGNWEPELMARHHLQIELRHDLAWLEPLTARAGEYKTELTAGEETKRAATAKLMALAGLAHDLENEVRGRADLERQLASTTLQLDDAKKALASPDCLTMEDGALLRLKLTADHLPSRIAELQTGIATATARISALLDQTGIDRAKFMAGMKAS